MTLIFFSFTSFQHHFPYHSKSFPATKPKIITTRKKNPIHDRQKLGEKMGGTKGSRGETGFFLSCHSSDEIPRRAVPGACVRMSFSFLYRLFGVDCGFRVRRHESFPVFLSLFWNDIIVALDDTGGRIFSSCHDLLDILRLPVTNDTTITL
jgi:hypothetical protein